MSTSADNASAQDTAPAWCSVYNMNATYALLYNTLSVRGAPYLPAQMSESAWRLVYGEPSVRNRSLCWADANKRPFSYAARRLTESARAAAEQVRQRISALRSSVDIEGGARERMLAKETLVLNRITAPSPERYVRPPRDTHAQLDNTSFEMQVNDMHLCGLHALHNVAGRVLLSPPDLMSAIELLRPLDTRFASLEELSLAALREGIFLLPVKLTSASDLNSLDFAEREPRNKFFAELLEEARGMILFQRSALGGADHYVSLVHVPESEDPDDEWVVYSFDRVVARGPTAADAIDAHICATLSGTLGGAPASTIGSTKRRETRRAELEASVASRGERLSFVGLLPMSLMPLVDDALQNRRFAELSERERERVYILRTFMRRSLSEMRVSGANGADFTLPPPVSPVNFDATCQFFACNASHDDDELHFDGLDRTNVASFVTTRFSVDEAMNAGANQLAKQLLEQRDCSGGARWSPEAREEVRLTLRHMRSHLRTLPALALLFGMRGNQRKFARLLSNRRWFRYFVVQCAVTSLAAALERPGSPVPERELSLLCFVAFINLQATGVKLLSTPYILRLYAALADRDERDNILPLGSAPANIVETLQSGDVSPRSPLAALLFNCVYDSALWLLQAIERARLPHLPFNGALAHLFALDPKARAAVASDDNASPAYDSLASFVILLRSTLFCMPFEGNDFALVKLCAPQQSVSERAPDHLGVHYNESACRFLAESAALLEPETALDFIDSLAFDAAYADAKDWRHVEATASIIALRSLDDERKPRFAERLAQCGFVEVYEQVFGALTTCPDSRETLVGNLDRLPLPSVHGQWMATRPRVDPSVQLATRPIATLPTRQESALEVARFAPAEAMSVSARQPRHRGPMHAMLSKRMRDQVKPMPVVTWDEPKLDYDDSEASWTECDEFLEEFGAYSKRQARSDTASEASVSEDTPAAFNRLSLVSRVPSAVNSSITLDDDDDDE
jgi:hypothetical protein